MDANVELIRQDGRQARVDTEVSGGKYGTVDAEQFKNVSRRVDRIEKSLESVAERMGLILGKLDVLNAQKRLAVADASVPHYRPTLIDSQKVDVSKINEVNAESEHQKEK
uniref:Uncharacterized protein n=1 Tax=Romanomermis culicivorax TaxID=13658 RepID=A0A915JFH9_ROMCU